MGLLRLAQLLARHRFAWFMLLALGIILEGCGLYFQYELGLQPCVNCVYERALYLTFILAGIVGLMGPSNFALRNLANLIFMFGSAWGVLIASDHLISTYQTGFAASCKLVAQFPSFLKLDEWIPWMFAPTASCGPLDWSLLGFSMPAWILLSFTCGFLVSIVFLITEFIKPRRHGYDDLYR